MLSNRFIIVSLRNGTGIYFAIFTPMRVFGGMVRWDGVTESIGAHLIGSAFMQICKCAPKWNIAVITNAITCKNLLQKVGSFVAWLG